MNKHTIPVLKHEAFFAAHSIHILKSFYEEKGLIFERKLGKNTGMDLVLFQEILSVTVIMITGTCEKRVRSGNHNGQGMWRMAGYGA